jgi:tetratricopeptide (TPR) repeat protein
VRSNHLLPGSKLLITFLVLAAFLVSSGVLWGSPATQTPAGKSSKAAGPKAKSASSRASKPSLPPGPVERLNERLMAASNAQNSGDLDSVILANQRLLGLALREMAGLRLIQSAFPQSAELYKRSLAFEEATESHEGLAMADLRLHKGAEALAEAQNVTAATPDEARAWTIQGRANMMLKDYRAASHDLAHSLSLKGDMEVAYDLATCLLELKEKEKAQMVFHDMTAAAGGDRASLHVLYGRAYRDTNSFEDAKKEFRRALQLDPKIHHAHYFLGLVDLIQNEWAPTDVAKQEFLAELRITPRQYMANYLLGIFASSAKEFEQSEAYLKIAAEEQPQNPEPYMYLGLNAFAKGDLPKAEDLLRKAIDLTGEDEVRNHYQIRKAYLTLGRILVTTQRKPEAEKWLEKARLVQQASLGETQQALAEKFHAAGIGMGGLATYVEPETEEKSIKVDALVEPTAKLASDDLAKAGMDEKELKVANAQEKQLREILGTGYNDLGTAEARSKQYDKALADFLEAERWNAEIPGLMRNLGIAAAKVGDHATAARGLSKQLVADPSDQVVRAMLGISQFMIGSYSDAVTTIEPLAELASRDPALAYPWAVSLAKSGKPKQAAAVLDGLEREQLSPDTLMLLAQAWGELDEIDHAIKDYHRAAEVDPSYRSAHDKAGLLLIRAGKPADAVKEFEGELAVNPDDLDARYNLGFAYLQQDDRDKARSMFEAVVVANAQHANAQYQLGKLMLDQGQVKDAITHLEAAAQLRPEDDYIHYQLQAAYRKDGRLADADKELDVYKQVKARNRAKQVPQPSAPGTPSGDGPRTE